MNLIFRMDQNNSSRRKFLQSAGILAAGSVLGSELNLTQKLTNLQLTNQPTEDLKLKTVIKPARLKPGDTIAITSPAGALWDDGKTVTSFTKILEGFGFKIKLGKTLTEKFGYFAGSDELRAKELNEFFADKTVKGIFCAKGGWGCARLLEKIDFALIEKNPKVLIGFSDITVLLNAIYAKTGLITFHGPVGNSGWNDFTTNSFKSVIMNAEKTIFPVGPKEEDKPMTLAKGTASGILLGGNLTVLTGIIGSKFLPEWKNKILFLEEAKEEPYSVDRMLTQMKLAGILKNISGFVFGKCTKCDAE
ncbi:MAG: LD-carboxypeptidase, partial [Bacteroidia bacterium]|nr:LD-carboxypeptidase [Bacteroidia bacterium]